MRTDPGPTQTTLRKRTSDQVPLDDTLIAEDHLAEIDNTNNNKDIIPYKKIRHDHNGNKPEFNFNKFCYRHNPDNHCMPLNPSTVNPFNAVSARVSHLPIGQQNELNQIFSIFKKSPQNIRRLIFDGLLAKSCSPNLSYVASQVQLLIKIDYISSLPSEISLKILRYLDCQSLCSASMVSKSWKKLADDDGVWLHLCEQHIDRKCPNCGWGLPLLTMKRSRIINTCKVNNNNNQVKLLTSVSDVTSTLSQVQSTITSNDSRKDGNNNNNICTRRTKPWKDVYRERFKVESNWRKGLCNITEFKGHTDTVLALGFNFRLLFTVSYDSTVGIWDLCTGKLIRRLASHTDGIKALYFDDQKLITGSLDRTIRVWNYRTGNCIATYRGHRDSVLSVDCYQKLIVSGSADCTIRVWHIERRSCYTLKGHTEWVNCVKLHPRSFSCYSASDDNTIRMWDLRSNKCLRIFRGHVGQVQKVIPLVIRDIDGLVVDEQPSQENEISDNNNNGNDEDEDLINSPLEDDIPYPTHLLSCSLDNTIKLWDLRSGKCVRTQFGHVEGVWDIAADNFRIVSGSHDGSVKVWDLQNGQCIHSFQGRKKIKCSTDRIQSLGSENNNNTNNNNNNNSSYVVPIACVGIGDSEFFSGDDSGCVKMYNFDI